jgi:hypothetical protein
MATKADVHAIVREEIAPIRSVIIEPAPSSAAAASTTDATSTAQ